MESDDIFINVAEAKRRFSELLDRVAKGEHFLISRRGKPAVALVSADEAETKPKPKLLGIAAFVGALAAEGDVLEDISGEAYSNRKKARDRPAPKFD